LRGELLGAEHLAERARALASRQRLAPPGRAVRRAPLLRRLEDTDDVLAHAHTRLTDAAAQGDDIGPAADWLLDNYHVVQEHVREVRESLPRDYYQELPELGAGPLRGYPRVYELATTLISHTEGRITLDNVDLFVSTFQERTTLSLGELWAIPAMIRLGLIESVRRMSLRTLERLDEVETADRWVERIQTEFAVNPDTLQGVLVEFAARTQTLTPAFVTRFLHQLRHSAKAIPALVWLESWIADQGLSADEAARRATERLALTTLMMANSITSLRAIGLRDWKRFVEHQSVTEQVLRGDPAGVYARMTFATRDSYRHAVERIAKGARLDESEVAREAIARAQSAAARLRPEAADQRAAHVGYHLIDEGLPALERALGYHPTWREHAHRWATAHPNIVFGGAVVLVTVVALRMLAMLAGLLPLPAPVRVPALLFALLPAMDIAVHIVNQILTAIMPPRSLPKLDLPSEGVPSEFRTAVVIPTLFASVDAVHDALSNLESQYLANREAHLHFAVLSDFTDADTATTPDDDAILEAAADGVRALNDRYAPSAQDAFYLFHRPRLWNPCQRTWMGWERKRGKLAEFNRFVRGGAKQAFSLVIGNIDTIKQVRYVITLDADTVLPPAAAPALIGALAHPLNRAIYDPALGRVVAGYGIIQPRVGVSLGSANLSRFAALHSGRPGVDPYTTAVSDVYQDLCGEGSYTGKGIYDIDAFERATHGRFPENTLLSHDLIEGNFARAGLASEISVHDDYPTKYLTWSRRKHRWIRGDWQLLRWLTPWVPGPDGEERNRLPWLARWKIFDNLRRSVTEIALLAFLVAGWTRLPGTPWMWTLLVFGVFAAPWVSSLLLAAARPPAEKSWRAFYGAIGEDAWVGAQQIALSIVFLPHQAVLSADAIIRTLWRMFVSKRRLLEWQTASLTERETSGSAWQVWKAMLPAVLLALGLGVIAFWSSPVLLPLVALWVAAPAIAHRLSAPPTRTRETLDESARAEVLRYAQQHWAYFDRFVSAETNWLVPDNHQVSPEPVTAMRTSPTNIGLQLLSTVSAHDLGFITREDLEQRLDRTLTTLEKLPRHRGHFFNWYDVADLRVLEPAYVSTVDSGNLAGHLIAVRQACLAFGLTGIAERAIQLAMEMDFRFLYDPSRHLFAIGYHTGTHTRDASAYDLLASEARLASFVAIAKHDVPFDHWFRLGRTQTHASGETALVSWSGSVFEYLMPLLVMRSFPDTLLAASHDASVERQIAYGAERGVPWGVSESAYNVRDRHLTYQYRAFGVPDLGLKRGLARDLVVAPYASALAMLVAPERALRNLQRLEAQGGLGTYGFFDAFDYTRTEGGERFAIVKTFMAHHIGMTLVSLTNALRGHEWQRRFHADPIVRATALLLDERVPRRIALHKAHVPRSEELVRDAAVVRPFVREFSYANTPQPHVALLGHTPFTVMVTHAGSGYARYEDISLTRWRADGTTDNTGQFCYIKDVWTGRTWSAAHQPTCEPADMYRASLATDRVTIERRDDGIATQLEIVVVPEDSAEVRRVTVSNHSDVPRDIELTSYGEIVLASRNADRAHPAFGNLFVETEYHPWCTAITATRRARAATESPLWCVHVVNTGKHRVGDVTCETDRARFIGRGRSTREPRALDESGDLSGTTGAVLDPIFALRTRVHLMPGHSASVAFTSIVATSKDRALELAGRYHEAHAAQRAIDLAWTSTQLELQELDITPAEAAVFQDLAGSLLYAPATFRTARPDMGGAAGWQERLWQHGISGDHPIVLATIASTDGLPTLQRLFVAHRYWRRRGMLVDLVVIDAYPHSYVQEMRAHIEAAMLAAGESGVLEGPGGVFVRRREAIDADAFTTLRTTARMEVACDGRSLARILEETREDDEERFIDRTARPATLTGRPRVRADRRAPVESVPITGDNGHGGLTAALDYRIRVRADHVPPAPWSNVVANERAGFVVSERGAGFSWVNSSYFYRLTPWHNDPVCDPVSDVLYLHDAATDETWSATPAPMPADGATYHVEHQAGASTFEVDANGIKSLLRLAMADTDAVKVSELSLTNTGDAPRRLAITSYIEWTLGVTREQTRHRVHTKFDASRNAILARNHFDAVYANWVAFSAITERVVSHTADRRAFLGRNGSVDRPRAFRERSLTGGTGFGLDPCAALRTEIELAPGETKVLVALLGAADSREGAEALLDKYRDTALAGRAVEDSRERWLERLGVIQVSTPEPTFDAMINRWSLYQALACRMWARSALYQSSGAFGFRDQLQDITAFVYAEPALARAHLLRAASRQFTEGDVQHWWHPDSGRGVRTRFSDDLAWLPYAVTQYVRVTGDDSVLDADAPFLTMRELEPDEHEVYDLPLESAERASLYEHCLRALRRACTAGAHGLPLIGTGDWNDGFSRVGHAGQGESVWLAWFLADTLRGFADLAERRGDAETASAMRAQADAYVAAVEETSWDGRWYRRAYFDDGSPLGTATDAECRIDSIAQSWSVISNGGSEARQARAMQSLLQHLCDPKARLVKLLTPPFDKTPRDPGYIKGYLPGVRENGAQYTHAALWAVLALAQRGEGTRAFDIFQMINPLTHGDSPEGVAVYKVEPYVVAADVYTAAGHVGRGGWTWYTGSASWTYRVGLEALLGFTKRGDRLRVRPRVPRVWGAFDIAYRFGASLYTIRVEEPGRIGADGGVVTVDGEAIDGDEITLVDDGAPHKVVIRPRPINRSA
jgi:cyclic beta-1,2-glucan synthetase